MLNRIKQALTLIGIFSLIAFFYITKKKKELTHLKTLLNKNYNNKLDTLQKKEEELKGKLIIGEHSNKINQRIQVIRKDKQRITDEVKKLETNDLASAINDWYKSK